MAGTMDKIKAKVDNVLHKDKHSDPTGPHDSHTANSADPRIDSDHVGTTGNTAAAGGVGAGQYSGNTHSGTGFGSNTHSSGVGGTTHSSGLGSNTHSTTGVGSNTHSSGLGSNTTHGTTHGDPSGPHNSKLANKLDPTVDTKSYGTADPTTGHYANTGATGTGLSGSHNTHSTGAGLGGAHNTHSTGTGLTGSSYNDPSGPHSSHMGNKADPRIDSNHPGAIGNTATAGGVGAGQYGTSGVHGTHNTSSGLTGSHGTSGVHDTSSGVPGSHSTSSGLPGSHQTGTVGSGNSKTTAGPHNSDMLNKADPRVDSNLDGSKTVGGNATYR